MMKIEGGLSEAHAEQKNNTSTIPDIPKFQDILTSPDTSFSEDQERMKRPRRLLKKSFVSERGGGREQGCAKDERRRFPPPCT